MNADAEARIVFGSPQAATILEKDREMLRREKDEQEAVAGNSNNLADRLERLESEIEMMEMELAGLEEERDKIKARMKDLVPPDPKLGFLALKKWNAWAAPQNQEQPSP